MPSDFRRARRPEQVAERRAAIVAVARELLADRRLADVSLNQISAEVGLAKSNVLRYFDSREAIYLTVLTTEWSDWLDELDTQAATAPGGRRSAHAAERAVASTLADTLAARPLLCELLANLAGVLERNISERAALDWKRQAIANADRLQAWVQQRLPGLSARSARSFAGLVTVLAGALWSYERPSPEIAKVNAEFGGLPTVAFATLVRDGLFTHLVGTVELAASRKPTARSASPRQRSGRARV
ncbi:MAG TPA: TetR family transcriptional regulator [Acidimicrobiales bacterium]|jgi:AcrR family transcriptional regulator|nr:TetR family transcriptional regulator [Acidimicrobiales bacterium]